MTQEDLCTTLAGNVCPLITITETQGVCVSCPHHPSHTPTSCTGSVEDRQVVVVSGRVHPGETNSSWIMEGLLHMLTSDTPHAKVPHALVLCIPLHNIMYTILLEYLLVKNLCE